MIFNSTLNRYLAKRYVINLSVLLFALLSVVYLFDTVELIRRASKFHDVPITLVLQMGLLKLPEVGQTLTPFAVLFSTIFTFWQLTRRYELIVVRASGFSVWQFLLPLISVGILFGVLHFSVINPIGSVFVRKFEDMERTYLSKQHNQVAVFAQGLWLRQPVLIDDSARNTGTQHRQNLVSGYVILHARNVTQPDWTLKHVTMTYFTDNDDFLQRVDAQSARLLPDVWELHNVTVHPENSARERHAVYTFPATLTREDIEESFSSPESMSFWKLPSYIQTLENTGFDATRLKVHYNSLMAQPLMLCAMILLAACVSMRSPRGQGTFIMVLAGIFMGFVFFFLSTFLQTLGASQQIPVIFAAWAPPLIAFLFGLSVLMNREDG